MSQTLPAKDQALLISWCSVFVVFSHQCFSDGSGARGCANGTVWKLNTLFCWKCKDLKHDVVEQPCSKRGIFTWKSFFLWALTWCFGVCELHLLNHYRKAPKTNKWEFWIPKRWQIDNSGEPHTFRDSNTAKLITKNVSKKWNYCWPWTHSRRYVNCHVCLRPSSAPSSNSTRPSNTRKAASGTTMQDPTHYVFVFMLNLVLQRCGHS